MPVPATTGQLRTTISSMQIGDYIALKIRPDGTHEFGGSTNGFTETPITGTSGSLLSTYIYMIKVDMGLLIGDRVRSVQVNWETINSQKMIQGLPFNNGIFRSLTGGVAYADMNGNYTQTASTTDYGMYPTNNEFDKYIRNSNLNGTVRPNDPNVWRHNSIYSWCQETPSTGTFKSKSGSVLNTTSAQRIGRSILAGDWNSLTISSSTTSNVQIGYRPVFEYKE